MYLIIDSFSGYLTLTLDMIAIAAIGSAIFVITVKNPIISVLCLIGLFVTISISLISSGMSFIGLAYLLVYVGAITILFIFILMLINIRVSELISDTKNSIPLVFIISILFASGNYILLPEEYKFTSISRASIKDWEMTVGSMDPITSIGNVLYGNYSILLILISIILLVAMVGAIVINVRPKVYQSNQPNAINNPVQSNLFFGIQEFTLKILIIICIFGLTAIII